MLKSVRGNRNPDPDELVFNHDGEPLAQNALLKAVQRIAPGVSQHGFRSTFADWRGDRTDFPAELAEFALAHVKTGTEGAYHRATSIEKRRALMQAWSDYLDVIEGENVVAFTPRAGA